MSQTVDFPQFSQLPKELRLAVWGFFALPRGPAVHSIWNGVSFPPRYLATNPFVTPSCISAVRSLMQVNHEAREEVLQGRELVRHRPDSAGTFSNARWCLENIEDGKAIQQPYSFINWDLDLFYFTSPLQSTMMRFLDEASLQKIRFIAVETTRFIVHFHENVFRPSCYPLFPIHYPTSGELLLSLERVFVVLPHYTLKSFIYKSRFPDGQPRTFGWESEEAKVEHSVHRFDEMRMSLPRNEFDFHPVDCESYDYAINDAPWTGYERDALIGITFQELIDKTTEQVEKEIMEFGGRHVGTEVMIGVLECANNKLLCYRLLATYIRIVLSSNAVAR
ncbi:Uu.00g029500.m01.CDS01 [Anthostomella pinea]|uniref:Uu.00g029500.m01.CDS01 n=1 Tax=Anthostomella pinea TaxID=933095 RepID=A0AAI8V8Q4_9PEZI|nr:Uu.00g029500.m01.CDS01 [Anthostomella pinea]